MQIYKITLPNGKIYIGQTIHNDIKLRTGNDLGSYYCNTLLYMDIMIHGPKNIKVETLESNIQTQETLDEREVYWINHFRSWDHLIGYNIQTGGKKAKNNYKDPYYASREYKELRQKYVELYRIYKDNIRHLFIKTKYANKYSHMKRGKITKEELDTWYSTTKQQIIDNARNEFIKAISSLNP